MNDELLPCPFCGSKAEIERTEERFEYGIGGPYSVMEYGYYVYCTQCGGGTNVVDVPPSDYDAAVKEWNRRAPALASEVVPDWPNSPKWANWWAVDPDGSTMWYEEEPYRYETVSFCGWGPKIMYGSEQGMKVGSVSIDLPLGIDWRTTLHQRPVAGEKGGEDVQSM